MGQYRQPRLPGKRMVPVATQLGASPLACVESASHTYVSDRSGGIKFSARLRLCTLAPSFYALLGAPEGNVHMASGRSC